LASWKQVQTTTKKDPNFLAAFIRQIDTLMRPPHLISKFALKVSGTWEEEVVILIDGVPLERAMEDWLGHIIIQLDALLTTVGAHCQGVEVVAQIRAFDLYCRRTCPSPI